MITLTPEIIKQIKKDKSLKIDVQKVLNISHTTLYKYLNSNDPKLANANVIQMLVRETGLAEDAIITT